MNLDEIRANIREELQKMRESGSKRQEMSLHACKRLFFDLGIRPTMATVRDLTQTGSASDIPKDIDHFWERIRSASKIRIGTGVIPPLLEERAGELLQTLFEEALRSARAELEEERQQFQAQVQSAEKNAHEASIRLDSSDESVRREEEKTEAARQRIRELEAELTSAHLQRGVHQDALQSATQRMQTETHALQTHLDTERAANTVLRERVEELHIELRERTEHYAQQIKDAIDAAERRVKPLLVELDTLRGMAATYQSGTREANRKEFEFLQQLAVTKAQSDRFSAQVEEQAEALDALNQELAELRKQQDADPALAALLYRQALSGRLSADELQIIGSKLDAQISLPQHCPQCKTGEPELFQTDGQHELACPECEHSSGARSSRLEAIAGFFSAGSLSDGV
ncbi:DNA-binding protein [Paraburkholderia bonniea]|uniref:DNA-binding protein n=1 Tax=Paraburkholderia bonniea TaxID=2152891 RepID=UPI002572C7EE|nr:DNA-binding protein [Paraburkholderia bonniea]WJF91819.1 DNA-binding protein [Paraburkholderia bonniea]WJF95138.1 DNA-binding protein [Paraburkholderia bonniea]